MIIDKELLWAALIALHLTAAALVVDRLWARPGAQVAGQEQPALQAGGATPTLDCLATAGVRGPGGIHVATAGHLNAIRPAPFGCVNVL